MFTNPYELEDTRGQAVHPGEQTGIEQFLLGDEFSMIPAYKEILPEGLISDEV